jgi:DNA-directed RNA polymerase beta' subunit
MNSFNDITSYSKIKNIEFCMIGNDENLKDSNSKISNSKILKDNVPVPDGIYNNNLGTTDNKFRCYTCYNYKTFCPGHSGHIECPYPLISPFAKKDLLRWLKIICFNCGNTILDNSYSIKDHIQKVKNLKENICAHCGFKNHKIYLNPKNNMFIMLYDEETDEEIRLFNTTIEKILNKISDETVQKLKKKIHPKNYVNRIIRVPAVTVRPDVKKYNGSRSNINDITASLKTIMMILEKMPLFIDDGDINNMDKKIKDALDTIELQFFSYRFFESL